MKLSKILIVDLEATCWENEPPKGQQSEILEIGYALVNLDTGEVEKNAGIIIRPSKSTVSPFCTSLTTITPEMASKGVDIDIAIHRMTNHLGSLKKYPLVSWGDYDVKMLRKTFPRDYPFADRHLNLKLVWALVSGHPKEVGMETALKVENIPLDGTHHRGVDDARNIAKLALRVFAHG